MVTSQHKWTQLTQQMCAPKLTGRQHNRSSSADEIEASDLDDREGTNHDNKKTRKHEKAKTFKNEDLPGYPGTKKKWEERIVVMFRDYAASSSDPWELSRAVEYVQMLWDIYFSDIRHTAKLKNDPVFFLVSSSYF